jgi:hypothetical protein
VVANRNSTIRAATVAAAVSIVCSVGAWLSLLAFELGAPQFPFLPGFLLLGATAALVAFAAFFVERTPLVKIACLIGMTVPVASAIWMYWSSRLPPDALG